MEWLSVIDFGAIFKIIMIDLLLGVDNAIVIALACSALLPQFRNKAILLGTGGAILLRAVLLVFATMLLGIPYLKLAAGLYLLYIGINLLVSHEEDANVAQKTTIFGAVWTIIVADFMLSLDNVMAVAGAATGTPHSTIYAVVGILFSIPVIVYGAKQLSSLIDKWPIIVWFGAAMLGVVGAEMVLTDPTVIAWIGQVTPISHWTVKAIGAVIVLVTAFGIKQINSRKEVVA